MMIKHVSIMLVMIAGCCSVSFAQSTDIGEVAAQKQYSDAEQCVMLPVYSQQPVAIGQTTGDTEKDTFAYTIIGMKKACWNPRIVAKTDNEIIDKDSQPVALTK